MDLVVVQDDMDLAGAGIGAGQFMQQANEQITTLVHPFTVGQTATVNVQGSGQIMLRIDSGSLDPFLLATQHVVRPAGPVPVAPPAALWYGGQARAAVFPL